MPTSLHVPDRSVVRQLQAIDRDLSVAWDRARERWCVYHRLQQAGRPDESARALAREVARELRGGGYAVDWAACLQSAYAKIEEEHLVHVVRNDDDSFRPLDGRVVVKFKRAAWRQANLTVDGWIRLAREQTYEQQRREARARENIWTSIEQDRVFRRVMVDLVRGVRPVRSVHGRPEERAA